MAQLPPESPSDASPGQQYLDGLMMAVPARESFQKVRSQDRPPEPTGDVIVDSEATRKWSEEVLRRSKAEFDAAKKQLDAIRARIGNDLQSLPPQVRDLMEFVINTEKQLVSESLEQMTPLDPYQAVRTGTNRSETPGSRQAPEQRHRIHV